MYDVIFCEEDKRFVECQNILKKNKIKSIIVKNKLDLELVDNVKIIVFPFKGIETLNHFYINLFSKYKESLFIFYNITDLMKQLITDNNIEYINLKDDIMFSKINNIASSEPTLKYIIEYIPYNFSNIKVAILGYGKYGKELYSLYNKLGMNIDVYVRREEVKNEIGKNGYLLNKLKDNIYQYNLIINTIPFNVIDEKLLHKILVSTLLLDVSSYPYGWNHDLAKSLGLNSLILNSIPSKYRDKEIGKELALLIKECINNE